MVVGLIVEMIVLPAARDQTCRIETIDGERQEKDRVGQLCTIVVIMFKMRFAPICKWYILDLLIRASTGFATL